jgi:putative endonuclease
MGFEIVATAWRPPERELRGDLDVVARRDDLVVFCEVKARRSDTHGGAAAAVTTAKQARVRTLAASWLRSVGSPDVDVRFDVIAIDGVRLTHYEAAF